MHPPGRPKPTGRQPRHRVHRHDHHITYASTYLSTTSSVEINVSLPWYFCTKIGTSIGTTSKRTNSTIHVYTILDHRTRTPRSGPAADPTFSSSPRNGSMLSFERANPTSTVIEYILIPSFQPRAFWVKVCWASNTCLLRSLLLRSGATTPGSAEVHIVYRYCYSWYGTAVPGTAGDHSSCR
eukprot:SAG11_NODE_4100_length_2065_cov_6.736521_1_plen_182_part_00